MTELGEHVNGVIFTTLVPSPWRDGLAIAREHQQVYGAADGQRQFSYLGMEVFINAKLLVEGLRTAGPGVTRESLVSAFETMGEKSFGAMRVRFGDRDHDGSRYVGLTMFSARSGRFVE